jgi:hypothetical protein
LSAAVAACLIVAAVLLFNERSETLANLQRAEGAERAQASQLWQSYRDQAYARLFSRKVGQRFESIKALTEAARIARSLHLGEDVFQDLRQKAITSLCLPDLRLERKLPGWSDGARCVIDESFDHYAVRDRHGTIRVRRVADGEEILRLQGTDSVLRLSPDGQHLLFSAPGGALKLWSIARNAAIKSWASGRWSGTDVLDFSLDSGSLAIAFPGEDLRSTISSRIKQVRCPANQESFSSWCSIQMASGSPCGRTDNPASRCGPRQPANACPTWASLAGAFRGTASRMAWRWREKMRTHAFIFGICERANPRATWRATRALGSLRDMSLRET